MRKFIITGARVAALAGAALTIAACSGSESAGNVADNAADNIMFEEPANDASALESAANATDMVPLDNAANTVDVPETSGGDTGGNSQQGNDVAGM